MRSMVDRRDVAAKVFRVMDRDGLARLDRRVDPECVCVQPQTDRSRRPRAPWGIKGRATARTDR